jgi:hypothetical protein
MRAIEDSGQDNTGGQHWKVYPFRWTQYQDVQGRPETDESHKQKDLIKHHSQPGKFVLFLFYMSINVCILCEYTSTNIEDKCKLSRFSIVINIPQLLDLYTG